MRESVRIPYPERKDIGHCALFAVPGGLVCVTKGHCWPTDCRAQKRGMSEKQRRHS